MKVKLETSCQSQGNVFALKINKWHGQLRNKVTQPVFFAEATIMLETFLLKLHLSTPGRR
jgi:hypothetical protein